MTKILPFTCITNLSFQPPFTSKILDLIEEECEVKYKGKSYFIFNKRINNTFSPFQGTFEQLDFLEARRYSDKEFLDMLNAYATSLKIKYIRDINILPDNISSIEQDFFIDYSQIVTILEEKNKLHVLESKSFLVEDPRKFIVDDDEIDVDCLYISGYDSYRRYILDLYMNL